MGRSEAPSAYARIPSPIHPNRAGFPAWELTLSAKLSSRRRRGGLSALFSLSILLILASSAMLVYELMAFSQREEQLPSGITVAGALMSAVSPVEMPWRSGKVPMPNLLFSITMI